MAVVYPNAVKVARMNAVVTAAGATAVLEIGTSGMASILATIPLANPIGSVAGAGVLTLTTPLTDASADNSGAAASARIRTSSGGTDIVTGLTVGTSGSDINLVTTTLTATQPVSLTSATITHA